MYAPFPDQLMCSTVLPPDEMITLLFIDVIRNSSRLALKTAAMGTRSLRSISPAIGTVIHGELLPRVSTTACDASQRVPRLLLRARSSEVARACFLLLTMEPLTSNVPVWTMVRFP